MKLIEEHIDNSEYNVEQLSADMGISRMNLYRKLQAITGQTPTEFIRTIRLKQAAQPGTEPERVRKWPTGFDSVLPAILPNVLEDTHLYQHSILNQLKLGN